MKFDMQKAHKVVANCKSHDDSIDHDYWNAHAAMTLPAALDRIAELERALIRERANLIEAGGESSRRPLLEEDQNDLNELARDQLRREGKL